MDIPSLIRFSSWLIPIPTMILFFWKTNKLDKFTFLTIPFTVIISIFVFTTGVQLGFRPELIIFYLIMMTFSLLLFRKKYNFPRALCIAVNLSFFGSLFWETPYHVYTIYLRGYLDQAFPLHLLYAFPAVFIWGKIKLRVDELDIGLIGFSLGISTLSMILLLDLGADLFWTYTNPPNLWLLIEITWMFVRAICFMSLYIIFYRGVLRQKVKKN